MLVVDGAVPPFSTFNALTKSGLPSTNLKAKNL
uniref:Uncharacterized protein n=1 Tax=Lepeophtheirus salmonis TaxID=72036 RepID=A0A0K2TX95_LEPSM